MPDSKEEMLDRAGLGKRVAEGLLEKRELLLAEEKAPAKLEVYLNIVVPPELVETTLAVDI